MAFLENVSIQVDKYRRHSAETELQETQRLKQEVETEHGPRGLLPCVDW